MIVGNLSTKILNDSFLRKKCINYFKKSYEKSFTMIQKLRNHTKIFSLSWFELKNNIVGYFLSVTIKINWKIMGVLIWKFSRESSAFPINMAVKVIFPLNGVCGVQGLNFGKVTSSVGGTRWKLSSFELAALSIFSLFSGLILIEELFFSFLYFWSVSFDEHQLAAGALEDAPHSIG